MRGSVWVAVWPHASRARSRACARPHVPVHDRPNSISCGFTTEAAASATDAGRPVSFRAALPIFRFRKRTRSGSTTDARGDPRAPTGKPLFRVPSSEEGCGRAAQSASRKSERLVEPTFVSNSAGKIGRAARNAAWPCVTVAEPTFAPYRARRNVEEPCKMRKAPLGPTERGAEGCG